MPSPGSLLWKTRAPYTPRGCLERPTKVPRMPEDGRRAARTGGADCHHGLLSPRPSQQRKALPGRGGRAAAARAHLSKMTQANTQVWSEAEPQAPEVETLGSGPFQLPFMPTSVPLPISSSVPAPPPPHLPGTPHPQQFSKHPSKLASCSALR